MFDTEHVMSLVLSDYPDTSPKAFESLREFLSSRFSELMDSLSIDGSADGALFGKATGVDLSEFHISFLEDGMVSCAGSKRVSRSVAGNSEEVSSKISAFLENMETKTVGGTLRTQGFGGDCSSQRFVDGKERVVFTGPGPYVPIGTRSDVKKRSRKFFEIWEKQQKLRNQDETENKR